MQREPVAIYVEYTCRGKRLRKLFPDSNKARSFYVQKLHSGADPKVVRAGDRLPEMPK
jgi:hypothetical protein